MILATGLLTLPTSLLAEDLLQVTHYALEQDPTLEISRLGVAVKQQQYRQANALLLPSITTAASYDYMDNSPLTDENRAESYSLSVTQKIYHRDQIKKSEQAQVSREESELALQLTYQQLLLRVARAYFNQLASEDTLQLAEQEMNAVSEQLKRIKGRYDAGVSALTDVQEAQARFDLINATLVSARAGVENSREALFEIINRELSPLQPLAKSVPLTPPQPADVNQWVAQALGHNLTLQQLHKQKVAASLAIESARSGYYPSVDLIGKLSHSENSNTLYGPGAEGYSVGIQAALPLYSGGGTRARVSEAILLQQQVDMALVQQQRSMVKTVRSSYLAVNTAIELVKAQIQVLSSAQTAFNATQAGVEVGTRTTVDLLDAQKELYSAHRDMSLSKYDLLLARLTLKESTGMLELEDVERVNQLLH
jgi:outer membrane protein